MTAEGEGVLVVASDFVFALHIFRGQSHVYVDLRAVVNEPGVGRELIASHRDQAHGFTAAGDEDFGASGADAVGGQRDGLQAGAAEPIDGDTGNCVGQTGAKRDHSRHVVSRLGFGHGAA